MNQQSLSADAPDPTEQFKHNISLASTSRSDSQRREALSFLTSRISAKPPVNPVGTSAILSRLLPLISDGSSGVRAQLVELFRALPATEVRPHVEKALMYIRAGMTHLSVEVRSDALNVMDWLLDTAGDEVVSCPGGWMKTLNSFSAMLGWNPSVVSATASKGWTSASKTTLAATKGGQAQARQIQSLAKFINAGFKPEDLIAHNPQDYWDNIYCLPRRANPFSHLNLFGLVRDEEGEIYSDCESRRIIFRRRWGEALAKGVEEAKREGGSVGRAAALLDKALSDGLEDHDG